jgi:hypothetical protein
VTSTEGIKTKNQSVITNEVLSMEEHPKIEFKKQFDDKSTFTDLVMVEVPLITIDKFIDTSMNTKISNINMLTQLYHEEFKPND